MALADYEVLDEIGRGGMGRVFRARHRATGALRALKVVDADLELAARTAREVEALARTAGANVLPIHEAGVERGRSWYVMPLMEGSLRSRFPRGERFPGREATRLVAELARAAERCHRAGVVHRDLKPANVLFDSEGRAYLADFGCARDLTGASLTATGAMVGTPEYAAPEQLEGQSADGRADVYALASMLHELIAGELPFGGVGIKLLAEKMQRRRTPLTRAGAPRAVEAAVARALEPLPIARWPGAGPFAEALEEALAARGSRARVPLAIAAVAVAVVVAAAATRGSAPDRAPPPAPPPVADPGGPVALPHGEATATQRRPAAASILLALSRDDAATAVVLARGAPRFDPATASAIAGSSYACASRCAARLRIDWPRVRDLCELATEAAPRSRVPLDVSSAARAFVALDATLDKARRVDAIPAREVLAFDDPSEWRGVAESLGRALEHLEPERALALARRAQRSAPPRERPCTDRVLVDVLTRSGRLEEAFAEAILHLHSGDVGERAGISNLIVARVLTRLDPPTVTAWTSSLPRDPEATLWRVTRRLRGRQPTLEEARLAYVETRFALQASAVPLTRYRAARLNVLAHAVAEGREVAARSLTYSVVQNALTSIEVSGLVVFTRPELEKLAVRLRGAASDKDALGVLEEVLFASPDQPSSPADKPAW